MLLAIDSGNTNVVFAIFDNGGRIISQWRAASNKNRTADEYSVWLIQLMEQAKIEKDQIKASIIANVVPEALSSLKLLCTTHFSTEALVVGEPEVNLDIKVNLENPREVGADRIVNAVAAHEFYSGAKIVIDFGTATTFDVISENGSYEGGVISPGVNLSLETLHQAAAQLPHVTISKPSYLIGKNTHDAMVSGIFWGYIGLIEGLIFRLKKEIDNETIRVISTGGLAPLFSANCDKIEALDQNLTINGLNLIYQRNQIE